MGVFDSVVSWKILGELCPLNINETNEVPKCLTVSPLQEATELISLLLIRNAKVGFLSYFN